MLDRASDYKYTIPEAGITIDGGIMPARDVANDGTWKILRGEDPCFLSEAARRCRLYRYYCDTGSEDPVPVDRHVTSKVRAAPFVDIAARIAQAADGPEYDGTKYAMPFSAALKTGNIIQIRTGTAQDSGTWQEIVNGTYYNAPLHTETFTGYMPGDTLAADSIRSYFYDIRKLGAICAPNIRQRRWTTTPANVRYEYDAATGTIVQHYQRSDGVVYGDYVYRSLNRYWPSQTPTQEFAEWELRQIRPNDFESGDTSTALSVLADAREPVSVTALFAVVGYHSTRTTSTWTQYCIPRSCTIDANGIVTLDAP